MTRRVITYVDVSHMVWDKRVFEFKEAVVRELKTSIRANGLIQPIVVAPQSDAGNFKLIVGRHRYQAIKELYKENPGLELMFTGAPVPSNCIPAVDVRNLNPEFLLNLEIHENIYRMDLAWPEKARALASLYEVEKSRFERAKAEGKIPEGAQYTVSDTAKKLVSSAGGSPKAVANRISQSLILSKQLDLKPDLAKAPSAKQAFNNLRTEMTLELRKQAVDYDGDTPHTLIVGDCKEVMLTLEDGQFDMILSDPPYGINAHDYDNMKEHEYLDTWENAQATYDAICREGFRLCKDRAHMFLFCTPERWWDVVAMAEDAGWISWPRPIIWLKSNEGMRPWGAGGLAYTYECLYWGTKGDKVLLQTANDVFQYYKTKPSEREHAAAKPIELYTRLFELTSLPGDRILDPCTGSGTTYKAGFIRKVCVTGIENNAKTAEIARKNLHWTGADEPTAADPTPMHRLTLGDL